ncbi:MAG: hypothetical protein VKI63_00910 [Cyanobium sp.]|nr:hypothetical protein [Cyanobium sp.]
MSQFTGSAPIGSVDTLVSGGIVVTMDAERRVIADGAVAIRDGRIVAVGERTSLEASCSTRSSPPRR